MWTIVGRYGGLRLEVAEADGSHHRTLTNRGVTEDLAWVRGGVPPAAPTAKPLSPVEVVHGMELQSLGTIDELAADGGRIAALIGPTKVDGAHTIVWTVGSHAVARASDPSPCDCGRQSDLGGLRITGKAVEWAENWDCTSSHCTSNRYHGALLSPRRMRLSVSEEYLVIHSGKDVGRLRCVTCLAPYKRSSRGLVVSVAGGTIRVRDARGRSTRAITPPGPGDIQARLTSAGLFYSYTVPHAAYPGRIVFVPYSKLR